MATLKSFWRENWLIIIVVLGLGAAFVFLRTPGDTFASMEALEARLQAGQPTVVNFYSNSCSICLFTKPQVDQLEADLVGQAGVLRLNVTQSVGREIAQRWGVRGVPTFFVVDRVGQIVYARAGAPQVEEIKAAVASSSRN